MTKTKVLTEREYEQVIALSEYAFQYKVAEKEYEQKLQNLANFHLLGVMENDRLLSKLHLLSKTVNIHQTEFKMAGVASVATWPEHRRGGLVKGLLVDALKWMKENNYTLSYLHPFKISFYRKFGWELFVDHKTYTFTPNDLVRMRASNGHVWRANKERDRPGIHGIYEQFASRYSGMLCRTEEWWDKSIWDEGDHVVVYEGEDKQNLGYLMYSLKNRHLEVHEFVALNEEATRGLWNFICQHDSMVQKVTMVVPKSDELPYLLDNPRCEQAIRPYFMARIVDVTTFLSTYPFQTIKNPFFLHIYDEYATWNNGSYLVKEGGIEVFNKTSTHTSCSHPPKKGIRLSINELSSILLGYQTPQQLYKIGKIEGNQEDVKRLEEALPELSTYFMDFF
ncbi:GNAT family N-acetyltransferase [Priestia koreensis]|uniref:N-acetyltransferase domain-containing protein n=1 Tax=Priestia koreensis TaxID=284581 RepID=A0A0M0LI19_9BACI|nr:GNAT family N-acetyltransferase [Priestia koreensis]KOO50621.1 hypothetical protein AMD01_02415 [Priestia koreensis]MCM3003199.1 GNAT family N-acetyltransferase [Priestia koreensis]